MKKVLSLLIALVFLQVQSWALSGGPVFGNTSANPSIIGTYGGVMIPTSTKINALAGAGSDSDFLPAAIGLFSISVPETGISIGVTIMFVDGVAFIGQIAGMGDGDQQQIQGVIGGTSSFQVFDPITGKSFPVFAQGSFKADVIEGDEGAFTPAPAGSGNGATTTTSTTTTSTPAEIGSTSAARIVGKAQVGTFFTVNGIGEPNMNVLVDYAMDGIKQNNIPSNVTTVPFSFAGATGG